MSQFVPPCSSTLHTYRKRSGKPWKWCKLCSPVIFTSPVGGVVRTFRAGWSDWSQHFNRKEPAPRDRLQRGEVTVGGKVETFSRLATLGLAYSQASTLRKWIKPSFYCYELFSQPTEPGVWSCPTVLLCRAGPLGVRGTADLQIDFAGVSIIKIGMLTLVA